MVLHRAEAAGITAYKCYKEGKVGYKVEGFSFRVVFPSSKLQKQLKEHRVTRFTCALHPCTSLLSSLACIRNIHPKPKPANCMESYKSLTKF